MASDITKLHPRLQAIIPTLISECSKQGIKIKIGECVRTVAEQDALYAQGRTKPGAKVTNAKGSTYSSMHQWGVAFDYYLDMDVDGDGSKSDDAFNNSKNHFNKVGAVGVKLGLEWGGNWKSPVDMPHFQLPDWGSTASKLKAQYGTPAVFMKTWGSTSDETASTTTSVPTTVTTNTSNTRPEDTKMTKIKKGSKGKAVKVWQTIIGTVVDGDFGPKTESLTKTFQHVHNLEVDGIVGDHTWKAGLESVN